MSVGSNSYTATTTNTATVTLENESRVSQTGSDTKVEFWYNLDATAQPEVRTISINATEPVADAYYVVTVDGPTTDRTYTYSYDSASADTEVTIAARLAEIINLHPDVAAVVGTGGASNTIIVTSVLPGTNGAFTLAVDCLAASNGTTVASKISETQTAAASGTGKVRKLQECVIGTTILSTGYPAMQIKETAFYDGAASPASVSTIATQNLTHPRTMDTLRTVA